MSVAPVDNSKSPILIKLKSNVEWLGENIAFESIQRRAVLSFNASTVTDILSEIESYLEAIFDNLWQSKLTVVRIKQKPNPDEHVENGFAKTKSTSNVYTATYPSGHIPTASFCVAGFVGFGNSFLIELIWSVTTESLVQDQNKIVETNNKNTFFIIN